MTPWTNFHGDQYIAKGMDDAANALAEYTKMQQQAEMQHGFVKEAVNRGILTPDSLAEFAKGNATKKLQIGADAALGLKMMLEQQQLGVQQQRNDIAQMGIAQQAASDAAQLGQRNTEFQRRGDMTYQTLPGGGAVLQNPGTGQQQFVDTGSTQPQELVVKTDPQSGQPFYQRDGKWFPVPTEAADPMKQMMAAILGKQMGAQAPGGTAPQGNPPMPPPPAQSSALPRVTTAAEYAKLPSGAKYQDAQGNTRTKR